MLTDIHKKRPILDLDFVGLPLAVLNDGTHAFVCSYDYLTNTQELIDGVNAYRTSKPTVETVLVMSGGVSVAASRTMESARIMTVHETVEMNR